MHFPNGFSISGTTAGFGEFSMLSYELTIDNSSFLHQVSSITDAVSVAIHHAKIHWQRVA
jgi:hypothetical protein